MYVGFIDLNLEHTEAIKMHINFYVARVFLPGLFQYILYNFVKTVGFCSAGHS